MILVDSSVWIDYFNGRETRETNAFQNLLGQQEIVVGDLMLTEVLQGFVSDIHYRRAKQLLREFPTVTMLGPEMAIRSADSYRILRKRGVTVRKTIDVMIGTYCIVYSIPLLYSDRDFDPMARYLGLKTLT